MSTPTSRLSSHRPFLPRLAKSEGMWMPLAIFLGCWFLAAIITAWGLSRWFRWVRGDFDKKEH